MFFFSISAFVNLKLKKKVLLRERIPTMAYQVLHLGYPLLGVPPSQVRLGGYPRWGTLAGVPPGQVRWEEGYLRWGTPQQGYPLARSDVGYPSWGTPGRDSPRPGLTGGSTQGGAPPTGYSPARSDGGYLRWGYPPSWTWLGYHPPSQPDLARVAPPPPRGVDRQTPVKTVPYRRTTYAVGKKSK